LPPDTDFVPLSRTVGPDRLVDEMIVRFTHTIEMDWMLPGVAPTGKRVECPIVAIVTFRDGKLSSEHILLGSVRPCWSSSAFSTPPPFPSPERQTARKLADPTLPSNQLIERARRGQNEKG
jgi:carboxymethylenebutenolidase